MYTKHTVQDVLDNMDAAMLRLDVRYEAVRIETLPTTKGRVLLFDKGTWASFRAYFFGIDSVVSDDEARNYYLRHSVKTNKLDNIKRSLDNMSPQDYVWLDDLERFYIFEET